MTCLNVYVNIISMENNPDSKKMLTEYNIVPPAKVDLDGLAKLRNDGNEPVFDELLENTAFDLIFDNENLRSEFEDNKKIVRSGRTSQEREDAAEKNRNILNKAKQAILELAGIHDIVVDEMEYARAQLAKLIVEDIEKNGDDADALIALGILEKGDDGKERFMYKRDIFPDSTNTKWHSYVRAVKDHVEASDNLRTGLSSSQAGVMVADRSRRVAHDAVARDIQYLLGFPGDEDGFDEARRLVAKMRENRFPTAETGERARMAKKVGGGSVLSFLNNYTGPVYDPESFSANRDWNSHD